MTHEVVENAEDVEDNIMMQLSDSDKKTLRLGAIVIAVYLVLFYGGMGIKKLRARQTDYKKLVQQSEQLRIDLMKYETDMLKLAKLKKSFQFDPLMEGQETLVSEVSAAIQKSAQMNGVKLSMVNETGARPSASIRASMRLEGEGPMQGVIKFLDGLDRLGFPITVDSVQLNANPRSPGGLKINLEALILDFNAFKPEEES